MNNKLKINSDGTGFFRGLNLKVIHVILLVVHVSTTSFNRPFPLEPGRNADTTRAKVVPGGRDPTTL